MLSSDHCPHCNTRVPRAARRCPVCGAPVSMARPSMARPEWSAGSAMASVVSLPARQAPPPAGPDDGGSGPPAAA